MVDHLFMLRAFVTVAQHRSFSKAASALGVSTASVSKTIAKLEASLRTRLLHRTTRSVKLTEDAQSYYLSCRRLLGELDDVNLRMTREREVDSGMLRLAVHPMLISDTFSKFLTGYRAIAPNVNLAVSVREGTVSLYDGQFDMAILSHDQVEHPAAIRRTLLRSPLVMVASAGYLDKCGIPERAIDLATHFLLVRSEPQRPNASSIELVEKGEPVSVILRSSMGGNYVLLRAAALAGTGIAQLPSEMVRDDIALRKLVHVLPYCSSTSESDVEIGLFYLHRKLLPARFRTFVDYCAEFFRNDSAGHSAGRLRLVSE